jgi:hypothetical protein
VIARYDDHAPGRATRGHAEGVALALNDEHGKVDRVELVLAGLVRTAGCV